MSTAPVPPVERRAGGPSGGAVPPGATPVPDAGHARLGRVVLVLGSLPIGGAEAQLSTLLARGPGWVARTELQVVCLHMGEDRTIARRLEALGVRITVIERSSMRFPMFLLALTRFLRRQRPDLVHAFLAGSASTWGRLAARLAGVPHVIFSDLSLHPARSRAQRLLDPLNNLLTDRFLPNATAIAERLQRQGVPARKIRVVRNGVDLERFDPARARSLRPAWGIPEDAVVAGFLGMFRRIKRPGLLLDGLLAMPEAARPDYVVMAGDGDMMPEIRRRVEADPWLRARCRLLGVVEDTPGFLRSLDFLVLTSDTEGLPNAIIEAMAMAVPSIATRVSDVPFLLGEDAPLFEPGDAAALAERLAWMTALPAGQRAAMGEKLQQRARAEFGITEAVAAFWDAHLDFLPRGP